MCNINLCNFGHLLEKFKIFEIKIIHSYVKYNIFKYKFNINRNNNHHMASKSSDPRDTKIRELTLANKVLTQWMQTLSRENTRLRKA